jgi:hypothetical protein
LERRTLLHLHALTRERPHLNNPQGLISILPIFNAENIRLFCTRTDAYIRAELLGSRSLRQPYRLSLPERRAIGEPKAACHSMHLARVIGAAPVAKAGVASRDDWVVVENAAAPYSAGQESNNR